MKSAFVTLFSLGMLFLPCSFAAAQSVSVDVPGVSIKTSDNDSSVNVGGGYPRYSKGHHKKHHNQFVNAVLDGQDFSGQDLKGQSFANSSLRGVNFRGTNLKNANFANADLEGADLEGADFRGANLKNASFSNANLDNAIFEGAICHNGKKCWKKSHGHCRY